MNVDTPLVIKTPGKVKKLLLRSLLALLILATLTAVVVRRSGLIFDHYAWTTARNLSTALDGARGVILVEYAGNIEISRRIATADEASRLRNTIRMWPRPFIPKTNACWVPHHSIQIARANGSEVNADICFTCNKFAVEDLPFVAPLPPYLAEPLASFFASVGMAPKTDEEYRAVEFSRDALKKHAANVSAPRITVPDSR